MALWQIARLSQPDEQSHGVHRYTIFLALRQIVRLPRWTTPWRRYTVFCHYGQYYAQVNSMSNPKAKVYRFLSSSDKLYAYPDEQSHGVGILFSVIMENCMLKSTQWAIPLPTVGIPFSGFKTSCLLTPMSSPVAYYRYTAFCLSRETVQWTIPWPRYTVSCISLF